MQDVYRCICFWDIRDWTKKNSRKILLKLYNGWGGGDFGVKEILQPPPSYSGVSRVRSERKCEKQWEKQIIFILKNYIYNFILLYLPTWKTTFVHNNRALDDFYNIQHNTLFWPTYLMMAYFSKRNVLKKCCKFDGTRIQNSEKK